MADFRQIYCRVWEDEWFGDLSPEGKVLWFWLLTNHRASVAGIYIVNWRAMSFESRLSEAKCKALISDFEKDNKLHYDGNVMWVCKLRDYQFNGSDKVMIRILKDVAAIRPCAVKNLYNIQYGYPIDTLSIQYPDSAKETDTNTDTETDTDTVVSIPYKYSIDTVSPESKPRKDKQSYGELGNVTLSGDEHAKILSLFGESGATDRIEKLSVYKASTGKKYASDYATILNWERREKEKNGNGQKPMSQTELDFLKLQESKKKREALQI